MKKIVCVALAVVIMFSLCACGSVLKPQCTQEGSFFSDKTRRFILVDTGEDMGRRDCYVYADKITGVMYMYVFSQGGYSGITPLYNTDGTLMIYDEVK